MRDLVDTRLRSYSTLEELGSVRELVQTAAKLSAAGKHSLAVQFVDQSVGEDPTTRSAMREEVRRCTTELQSHASGLQEELRSLVQNCTHDVEQLQARLENSVGQLRSIDLGLTSQISALDRRINSTLDPLAASVSKIGASQREAREELRERTTAQLDALRQHVDGKLHAQETNMLRISREMSGKFEEHRRSCDDAVPTPQCINVE
jgi:DNA anti-recombination protein RmuC